MRVGSFVRPDYENQHQFHASDDNHKYRGKKNLHICSFKKNNELGRRFSSTSLKRLPESWYNQPHLSAVAIWCAK